MTKPPNRHAMICLSGGVLNRVDPFGARCIMAALEGEGEKFGLFLQDRIEDRPVILKKLTEFKPDILWISIQPLTPKIYEFVKILHDALPGTPLILGNVGARGFDAHELTATGEKAIVVLGQGEEAAVRLLELYRSDPGLSGDSLKEIPNLRFSQNGKIIQTPFRPDRIKQTIVPSDIGLKDAIACGDVINARASNGCDGHCTFCTVRLINNGQSWTPLPAARLVAWLEKVVLAGKQDGSIAMTDDDLAGSLENLQAVAEAFRSVNTKHGTDLKFNFSTRANHLFDPKDSVAADADRLQVWKFCVESGLQNVFLGLESGSDTQLRRYGKGCTANTNRRALARAKELGLTVEIGFIPIDQMMSDGTWRQELRDNLALAKAARVAVSCPTWLAPSRVYKGAPLAQHLKNNGLLGKLNMETEEYETRFASNQVVELLKNLGPALCEGDDNGYYRFKRELKAALRYPMSITSAVETYGEAIIIREIKFVEDLTYAQSQDEVTEAQIAFASDASSLLARLQGKLLFVKEENNFAVQFLAYVAKAKHTLSRWQGQRLPQPAPVIQGAISWQLATA